MHKYVVPAHYYLLYTGRCGGGSGGRLAVSHCFRKVGDHIKVTCHICMGAKGWDGTKSILVVYILGMSPQ